MRRGFGAGLSALVGLVILFSIPSAASGADLRGPQIELSGQTPIHNGDVVTLSGSGFQAGEALIGFGAVVQIQNEEPFVYRGFDLPHLDVRVNTFGEFRLDVPLEMLSGIRGHMELALYYGGAIIQTDFLPVHDPGIYKPSGLDATAGTLYFLDGTFNHGGPGEDPVVNSDDAPLTSNGQGDWAGALFLVNLERYTSTDGTGTSSPYNNLNNDVAFSGGDLTSGSSAIVASLNATYKSIRMTVMVWDVGNYNSIVGTTTTGSTQGTGWLSSADVTAPTVSSAVATSLTRIVVTFSENVSTPSTNAAAIDNWTVTFNGNKAVSALSPLGSSGTATCTLTVADLGDRGATPTVQFTTGTDEFEDGAGNDCESTTSPHITASDGIAPATPTLDSPTGSTYLGGSSMSWSASAGAGTDNSLVGLELQGSDNGSDWDSLGVDTSSPYSGTYTYGTRYSYYRAQAYDTQDNTANSSATENLQDANHLDLTTIPSATAVNVESGQWTVTVKDNYGNAENVTQTIGLNSESSTGDFRAVSGGPTVGSINLTNESFGNFYYIDSQVGTYEIKVTNASLLDDSTDYQITAGSASKILIKLPGQAMTSGIGVFGTPDFSSYGGDFRWALAGGGFPIVLYIVDDSNNRVYETGSRDIDFTTTAGAAPDGTTPTVNGSTFPVNNISVSFTNGESTTSLTVILYDFTDGYTRVNLTVSDDTGGLSGDASTGFWVLFDDATHIGWTNSSGAITTTPINGTQTAGSALPTLYVSALDQYDNRDTTYTGSTISTAAGTSNPPINSPSGKGQGGTSLPNGNTPPDYGTNSSWSAGTVTLLTSDADQRTVVYAATTSGFRILASASGGTLNGESTANSDLFNVNYASHNYVRIEDTSGGGGTEYVGGESFTTADSPTFWSISYDQWGNTRGNEVVYWTSTNLTPAADSTNSNHWTFSPTAANSGNGTITADASTGTDRTITNITVTSDPTIVSIKIRTASGGGGSETGAMEIAGAPNGANYNRTDWMYAAGYNSDGIYISDVNADWAVTGTLTETGGSGFENADPASSNRYTAVTSSNQSGYITATYNSLTDSTGVVTVDATKPATVANFDVTEDQNQYYVNAFWDPASSYDDGRSAASGNVEDFDIRFSALVIDDESDWNAATTVGTSGKPSSFNGTWSWRIDMSPQPSGYYYYAIKTMDPQGNWSDMGSGCYTTSPDYSLPVTLSAFQARGGYGKITVTWSTESEIDAMGFRLLRDTSSDYADPVLVASYETSPGLICQGSSATGFDYSFEDYQDLNPEQLYYYRLEAVDINGRIEASLLEASAAALPLPTDYALGPNFPNPFNPVTRFELKLPQNDRVVVSVYNVMGREVARLVDGKYMEAGVHQLSWNGTNGQGLPVPSGLYFCRLQTQNAQRILKMLLLK